MSTVLELLKGVTNYPVPARVLNRIALVRDIELTAEVTTEIVSSKDYQLAEADVMRLFLLLRMLRKRVFRLILLYRIVTPSGLRRI